MKKYLREIELSGMTLLFVGWFIGVFIDYKWGAGPCGVGLLLMLVTFLYKAFHWKEYQKENKRNIFIIIGTIFLLLLAMLRTMKP